ncbi:18226_t:CDS:2 [Funneliformis geosporum]|nr:18226_t:CDS:2 [Funneliformis geosporum]
MEKAITEMSMIPTPGDYTAKVPDALIVCNVTLPDGTFPLPRCVNNKIMSMQMNENDMFDLTRLDNFKVTGIFLIS